ncbi:hypothetical protein GQS52_00590 [Streptomyces sp. SCUT-3]|uniref:baeRF2 domain-containing protein n=1 Tax=Streptomyces sp. SCUT-3 TaxID=2684469 RepID=UPI000CBDA376|nr:hypothetical protein [Streptomyces sp. SCUT-3]PLW66364.1 hypothetical protein C0036_23165 [Streptomyces sp. DJ]QMV20552.1 hypothetical protein GQS52_00590 [Streptomyces sp. SCUT-3]
MELTFLSPLYARQGPFACVYVDTSRDVEDPDRAIELRRRHLKEELEAQGADPATTGTLARTVGTDQDVPGPHGQAVFAAHGRLALAEELPRPPTRDRARFTMVPDAMPLALQHAPDIPYAAVVMRRVPEAGRETAQQDLEVEFQTGRWPVARVAAGERTLRRVPAGDWRQEAGPVAGELAELADRGEAETIVLSGDLWARGVLTRELPGRLRERVIGIESDGRAAEPGRALLEEELDYLFRGRANTRDQARIEAFRARTARGGGAAEGLVAVVEALREGRADALLVNDPADLSVRLWVGTAPKQIGLSDAELNAYGVHSGWEEPADAALLRAAVGTRAELVVVPREELPMTDGLGVLLRGSGAGA